MAWEWSDIRCFLAVAEAGTTLGAAKALAMNQTTCARRIAALEAALRLKLFDRSASGYALTPEGAALLPAARSFGDCAAAFERAASSARAAGIGVLRLTTNDGMADSIVTPAIVRFRTLHPDVLVDLNITDRLVDLASGEADIAIRGSLEAGGGPGLIQRRLPDLYWGFYCGAGYASPLGRPANTAEAASHPVASLGGVIVATIKSMVPGAHVVDVTNSIGALIAVLRAGYCIGPLPCHVGDASPGLERCFRIEFPAPSWLVYAERLKGRPEARALIDFLVEHFESMRPQLVGEP